MSNMCYRPNQKTVYSFGGYGSVGTNYQLKLSGKQDGWEEYARNYTALSAPHHDLELVKSSFIYIKN